MVSLTKNHYEITWMKLIRLKDKRKIKVCLHASVCGLMCGCRYFAYNFDICNQPKCFYTLVT